MTRWSPSLDPVLAELHGRGVTDLGIARRMLDLGFPVAAGDVRDARKRLGLKYNPHAPAPEPERKFKDRPNPLAEAKQWLGSRLTERQGDYWLDGKRAKLEDIMRLYNRMRVGMGLEQICHSEKWRIEP